MQAAQQQELEAMTDMFNKYALTLPPKPIRDGKAHPRAKPVYDGCFPPLTRTCAHADSHSWPCTCAG